MTRTTQHHRDLVEAIANLSDTDLKDVEVYIWPYIKWLSTNCVSLPSQLVSLLREPQSGNDCKNATDAPLICRVLTVIIQLITSQRAASIAMIGRELRDQGFLTLAENQDPTHEVHQLVFALLGYLTTLYKPASSHPASKLLCEQSDEYRLGMRRPRTWISEALDVSDELVENRIENLLVRLSGYSRGPFPMPSSLSGNAEPLSSAKLSYYTLAGLGGLHIQWVDSVLEHLELDENSKTLKLFRLPSFCVMLCLRSEGHRTFLEQ